MQTISEVKNGFKETEIGLIPEDWKVAKLKDFAKIRYGKAKPKTEGNIPVVGSGGIYGWTKEPLIYKPTIVIGRKGTAGNVYLMSRPCWPCDTTFYLDFTTNDINPKFLFYLMNLKKLSGEHAKTTLPSLQRTDLENYLFPLPPKVEQQKIAFILSKIQATIQQQDKIIEATKNLKKSLMHKLFTEGTKGEEQKETEIGLIPKSWSISELGNVAIQRKELVLPCQHSSVPYVGLEHIDPWNVSITRFGRPDEVKSSKYKFYKNDILYGKLRPYLDKAVLANFNGLCSTDIIVIKTSEKVLPLFLVNLLHLRRFVNYATSTMTGVNHPRTSWTAISKFKLPLPPLHEQQEIANILSLIDKKIEIEERRKATLQQLFKTMLNKLMTGEIRVKDLDLGITNVS